MFSDITFNSEKFLNHFSNSMQILSSLLVNVLSFNSGASFGIGNVLCENAYTDDDIVVYDVPTNISFFDFTMDSRKASWIGKFIHVSYDQMH